MTGCSVWPWPLAPPTWQVPATDVDARRPPKEAWFCLIIKFWSTYQRAFFIARPSQNLDDSTCWHIENSAGGWLDHGWRSRFARSFRKEADNDAVDLPSIVVGWGRWNGDVQDLGTCFCRHFFGKSHWRFLILIVSVILSWVGGDNIDNDGEDQDDMMMRMMWRMMMMNMMMNNNSKNMMMMLMMMMMMMDDGDEEDDDEEDDDKK